MNIPFGSLITQASNARGSYLGGKREGEQDALTKALLARQLSQEDQKSALAKALNEAQIKHLGSQTEGQWGNAFAGEDENGPGMFQQHKTTGEVRRASVSG